MLAPGTKLGPYEIVALLGAGGMGEVYRARDLRLERTVAIKILPAEFSCDPVRKQRFEREAKTISSLNHPHICVLHDVGQQDGIDYLVMEYVEGETLAKRLEKGPLPLEQVLKYGTQIADALDKAHHRGVVHRDLKPGNVVLTPSGGKLLDFGLAKPSAPSPVSPFALTAEAAQVSSVTEQGTIVGTFQYMSPEQIEGKELDGRSDIFSFGAVLYEMVTGRPAFEGKSKLSIASAILEKEPAPIGIIKPLTPPALDHAIRRSLAKNPDDRWQTARDLALELKWIAEGGSQYGVSALLPGPKRKPEHIAWALVAIFLATSLAVLVAYLRYSGSPAPVIVADVSPPQGAQFDFFNGGPPAISPNGRVLVFSARGPASNTMLWLRSLDGSTAQPLPGTEESVGPFWSSDSRRIGFVAHRRLQAIDAAGGPALILSDAQATGGGATWNREGTILFVQSGLGISRVAPSGGAVAPVIRLDTSRFSFFSGLRFLPDGKHFLYTAATSGSAGDTYFASLDGKEDRLLLPGGGRAVYASGFLLYSRGTTLMAQRFDPERGQFRDAARPIAEQVAQGDNYNALFDASENGVLAYLPARQTRVETQLAWFERSGKRLASIGVPAAHFDVRLSPDARRLASSVGLPQSEIWVDDLGRGVRMRLTFDPDTDKGIPVWSPDGSRILFSMIRGSKARPGIYQKASNGTGDEELLLPSDTSNREAWATDWSRDGRFVLFARGDMANKSESDIWVLPLTGERKPSLFLHAAGAAYDGQFSPDGRWVAYTSRESGREEVYVMSFESARVLNGGRSGSTPGGKWQISSKGGRVPRWRRDGRELFYATPDNNIVALEVEGRGASFEVGRSQRLFRLAVNPFELTYDVSPDGKRFVMGVAPEDHSFPLTLMFNWTARMQTK